MDDQNPMKKIKLITDLPPIQNRLLSASNTPTVDEGRIVDIPIEVFEELHDLREFLDDSSELPSKRCISKQYKIDKRVMRVLQDEEASGEELRDAVFTDFMDNHAIRFLESSILANKDKNGSKKYTESCLNTCLVKFGKLSDEQETNQMRRILRALPVTTTSKPDLVPLRPGNNGGIDEIQIVMGEFKNADKYTEELARTQCLMYLIGLIYWLRCVRGQPVEDVYGFYFCGRRCSDSKGKVHYTVGLLKLSAPKHLGGLVEATCSTVLAPVTDPHPLQLLIHFLKNGRKWTIDSQTLGQHPIRTPLPCFFVLPTDLWQNGDGYELVVHGTLSIVFRVTAAGLGWLLKQPPHFSKLGRHRRAWEEFCVDICGKAQQQQSTDGDQKYFYLKIRSKDASCTHSPMGFMGDMWDVIAQAAKKYDWLDISTYLDPPFVHEHFGVVVMNDRGRPLKGVLSLDTEIFPQFSKIIKTAMFLAEHLPHGDVLPHNLVYDETSKVLTLIDLDEGVRASDQRANDHILQRKNEYCNDAGDWYIALSYPNSLRRKAKLYTKCQLVASFLYIVPKVHDNNQSQKMDTPSDLADEATKLGDKLCELDKKEEVVVAEGDEELTNLVDSVYDKMSEIVSSY